MERWEVFDAQGNSAGRTIADKRELKEGERRLAVEVWPINPSGEILIQRRSMNCEVLPGYWALTTGKVQAGERPVEGAVRELREEFGLGFPPENFEHIRRIIRAGDSFIWNIYRIKCDMPLANLMLDLSEVSDAMWINEATFRAMLASGEMYAYPEIESVLSSMLA